MTDIVHDLLKYVTRAFYDTRQVIVMDAVLKHSALRDDHLATILGTPVKELHKICGQLREDRIISAGTKGEKLLHPRAQVRQYYYVDYQVAVDCIKWRIHKLVKTVEDKMMNDSVAQTYVCPRCQSKYSSLDVNMLLSGDGTFFQCSNCGHALQSDRDRAESMDSRERLGRLMNQISKVIDALKSVDQVHVPTNTLTIAMVNATLPPDPEFSMDYDLPKSKSAVSLPSLPATHIEVDFTSGAKTASQLEQERLQRASIALQNALPVWHTQSTIGGDVTPSGPSAPNGNAELDSKMEQDKAPAEIANESRTDTERAIAEYYQQLRQKQIEGASEDEEEEFEDVDMIQSRSDSRAASVQDATMTDERSPKKSKERNPAAGESDEEEDAEFEDF